MHFSGNQMKNKFCIMLLQVLLCGCASGPVRHQGQGLKVTVTSLAASGANLAAGHSFGFSVPSGDEPLVDARIQELFAAILIRKGYVQAAASPDWTFICQH